jgi:paraquat-inducible protein B
VSADANQWKLGAFVVGAVLAGLGAAAAVTGQALQVATVDYTSFLDEAVTGLEAGAPVSYRGVKIGHITAIDVAPDRRHVELRYVLGVAVLARLGLVGATLGKETKITVPEGLRVQMNSTGMTGTKYLQLDFFDTGGAPPPSLPFPVPENYIPATPSTMKNLEAAVVRAVDQLPVVTQALAELVAGVGLLLAEVNEHKLPGRTAATLANVDRLVLVAQRKLEQVPVAELSHEALSTMQSTGRVLARVDSALAQLEGAQGLLATLQRTSDSVGVVAGPELASNLERTGRDLREAAGAVRQLMEALNRDPDMLLKGKAQVRR